MRTFAERFALRTHVEQRPVDVYLLTLARRDGRLGQGLTRSDPSCVEARVARQPLPTQCRENAAVGGRQYRAMQISDFVTAMSALGIDRPGGVSLFTALQEQAGLKLEPHFRARSLTTSSSASSGAARR